jgi:hypothetical protein
MLFRSAFHREILGGNITLTFRRWSSPRVKAGRRYRFGADGVLEVRHVGAVEVRDITAREAKRAGYAGRDQLLVDLAKGDDLLPADRVYRIAFRYVGEPDPRAELAKTSRLSDADAAALIECLARMDRASTHGPWTRATLELIQRSPRVPASRLAAQMKRETLPFKADVRKLKALGLTRSFEVGYEVSPRGRALLRRLRT